MQNFLQNILSLSVGGSLLALGVLVLGRVKKLPKSFLYYAWLLVLLRLAVPLPGSLTLKVPEAAMPLVTARTELPQAVFPEEITWLETVPVEAEPVRPQLDVQNRVAPPKPVYTNPKTVDIWDALGILWGLGVMVCLGRDLGGYLRFRRSLRGDLRAPLPGDLDLYLPLAGRRGPKLLRCPGLDTPMLMGVFRPVLLLPDRDYRPETLECIFRHELTHYRRGDIPLKWFAMAVLAAHWFNPMTILVRRAFHHSCELSCDETILKTMDHTQRKCYGETLLVLAARGVPSRTALSTSFCAEKRNLKERLVHIMNFGPKSKWILAITAVLLVGVVTACLALGPARKETVTPTAEEQPDDFMQLGVLDLPLAFTGEDLRVNCTLNASPENWGDGVGLLLLLDGQPQPYRTVDGDELQYMHTFTQQGDAELVFYPVAGHAGETVELAIFTVEQPSRYTPDPSGSSLHGIGKVISMIPVDMKAEPGQTPVPAVTQRVQEAHISFEEGEPNLYDFRFTPGPRLDGKQKLLAKATVPEGAEMFYTVYLNHEPVFWQNLAEIKGPNRAVIDATLDLSDFQGEGILYAIFYGQNPNDPGVNDTKVSDIYYLSQTGAQPALPGFSVQTNVTLVSNVDEFLAAIGPDTHIALAPGVYDLSRAKNYGTPDASNYYSWEPCADGYGLSIRNVDNLSIVGDVETCELVTRPRYAPVVHFVNCTNITIRGLTAGHAEGPGGCMGAVVMMTGGSDFEIRGCDLYGCGTYGVEGDNCTRITVANSTIRDCSLGAATFTFCQDVSLQENAVYGIGLPPERASNDAETRRAYEAYSLFSFNESQMCGIINCDISDSNARTLLTTNSSQQVYFLGNPVSGLNISRTVFPSSGSAPVVDGCSFDFENKPEWMYPAYGGIDYVFSVQGEKLDGRDLAAMKHKDSAYSLHSAVLDTPEAPAPIPQAAPASYPKGTQVVEVRTVDEFLAAIAPNTTVVLPEGAFPLNSAADYGKSDQAYYQWVDNEVDGFGLKLMGLQNFHIFGAGQGLTNLEAEPRYSDVLHFEGCQNISVCGITAGHTKQKSTCVGGVLGFTDCAQTLVADCGLYGCGILGVDARKCKDAEIRDTEIYECSQGAVRLLDCKNVDMKNLNIHDCPSPYFKIEKNSKNISLDGQKL